MIVGVISDTHGLLRPQVITALRDCEQIIHAGDIGEPKILEELSGIAPTTAIRGNIDREEWSSALPEVLWVNLAGHDIYVLHDLKALDLKPKAAGLSAVISGHTHQPKIEMKDGVLYLNPGSVGPRRFKLPVSMGKMTLNESGVKAELIELSV